VFLRIELFEPKQCSVRFNGGRESEEGKDEGTTSHAVSGRNLLPQIEGPAHSQESFACRLHHS